MHAILRRPNRVLQIAAALFSLVAFITAAHADIFQWEYINPADPSQGKQQSTTLAPDGAGVDAVPGADLSFRVLTMADLHGASLTDSVFLDVPFGFNVPYTYIHSLSVSAANVAGTNLSRDDLTNADLAAATLTDANFADADIRGARFDKVWAGFFNGAGYSQGGLVGTGITLTQLYSTVSYHAHDLSGIALSYNDLASGNFAGQNLSNANFEGTGLSGADFRNANLTNVTFIAANLASAKFAGQNLTGVNFEGATLTGVDFAGQNLTNANLSSATLTDAAFTGAEVRGANFSNPSNAGTGITLAKLYSTASYQSHDLTGIGLGLNNLAGSNLIGQNLTVADLSYATLTGANLNGAILSGANVSRRKLRGRRLDVGTALLDRQLPERTFVENWSGQYESDGGGPCQQAARFSELFECQFESGQPCPCELVIRHAHRRRPHRRGSARGQLPKNSLDLGGQSDHRNRNHARAALLDRQLPGP